MQKKYKVLGVICAVIAIILACMVFIHTPITDRINPFIPQVISYAKVAKGTQQYRNVQAYDLKTKKALSYKIRRVGGYDPSGQYISINHKGQYVKSIRYISKETYENK